MKRVLITGSTGFVGSRLVQKYKDGWEIITPSRQELDIANPDTLHKTLEQAQPELVIHTAALSNTGYCEAHPLESFVVNMQLPHQLAIECRKLGAKLVFFSSDQVYNGTKCQGALPENALLSPVNVYGRHKLEAEQRVLEECPDAVGLRATWMYDVERYGLKNSTGFLGNLQQVLQQKKTLRLPVGEYRGVTWVMPVVDAMEKMADLPGGIYNMGAENPLNTYATALFCLERMGAGEQAEALLEADTEFTRNLSMDTGKMKDACGVTFGDTVDSFAACWDDYQNNKGGNNQ